MMYYPLIKKNTGRKHTMTVLYFTACGNSLSVAKAIGGEVAELDPLAPNVIENFRRIADAIAKGAVQP